MKWRKKPVVIDAFRWTGGPDQKEDPEWLKQAFIDRRAWLAGGDQENLSLGIKTLEGTMCARPGDYVIRGVAGEIYPCKPDIFEKTYEPAE